MIHIKESDLFEPVKEWLQSQGYTVYSEVSPKYASGRADVVGVNNETVVVIEMKQSLSLDLLEQAANWAKKKYANYVYVAVPWKKYNRQPHIDNWIVRYICEQFGIGVIFVDVSKRFGNKYYVHDKPYIPAKYHRIGKQKGFREGIEKYKHEYENSDIKGGQKGGGFITPYKVTIDRVKEFLQKVRSSNRFTLYWYENGKVVDIKDKAIDGWADINTILNYCETHYASPKPSLSKALRDFEIEWCESKKEKGKLWFKYKI